MVLLVPKYMQSTVAIDEAQTTLNSKILLLLFVLLMIHLNRKRISWKTGTASISFSSTEQQTFLLEETHGGVVVGECSVIC